MDQLTHAVLMIIPLLLGVILHEIAHGWTAEKFGDPTARMMGRITLNPVSHIDPIGTVLLPLTLIVIGAPFLFGWAKPVPVRFEVLRGGRKSMAWVALSGPMTNFLLAVASALIFRLLFAAFQSGLISGGGAMVWIAEPLLLMARISVIVNLVLMTINLLPFPPLDGGRICVGLLPEPMAHQWARLERFGILIVLVLIMTGLWSYIVRPVLGFFMGILLGG